MQAQIFPCKATLDAFLAMYPLHTIEILGTVLVEPGILRKQESYLSQCSQFITDLKWSKWCRGPILVSFRYLKIMSHVMENLMLSRQLLVSKEIEHPLSSVIKP